MSVTVREVTNPSGTLDVLKLTGLLLIMYFGVRMRRCRFGSLREDPSGGVPLQCETCALPKRIFVLTEDGALGYFGGGLGGDKDLQEPFLRAHLTAALAKGEGEIHVGELPEVGVVGVTIW